MAEFFRPGDQRAVAGDLVVLDGLRIGDDRRIEHRLVLDLAGGSSASLIRPSMAGQSVPDGLLAELLEHLVQPLDLLVGFLEMQS